MNEDDMTAPVTRGELKQELATFKQEYRADLDRALVDVVRKADLDAWGNRLSAELAQHVNAIGGSLRADIRVIDDQYKDLPGRVVRLETAVFPAKPSRRRRSS